MCGKEDMWDSGCIESYESESAAEQERERLNLASSPPPPPSSASGNIELEASTPLNEEAKKTYAEVCRGAPAASSSSNDDKGDLASSTTATEDGERVVSLLFCGESLKIVEDSKNDGEKVGGGCGGDDGKAASSVTPPVTLSDSTVAAVAAAAKEAKDNIDECEGPATSPPPGRGTLTYDMNSVLRGGGGYTGRRSRL